MLKHVLLFSNISFYAYGVYSNPQRLKLKTENTVHIKVCVLSGVLLFI